MEMNYCRRCGEPLTTTDDLAYTCKNSHTLYANPAPCVGIFLVDSDGNVVLSVRGIEPAKGMLDSIGGFIDGDESFEEALGREIREETGLTSDQYGAPTYLISAPSSYQFGGETRSVLSCFYYARLNEGAEPKALDDVAELVRVAPSELRPDEMWANDVQVGIRALLGVIT
jgi:NAD+ diphosphatase